MNTSQHESPEADLSQKFGIYVQTHIAHHCDGSLTFFQKNDRLTVACRICNSEAVGPTYAWLKAQTRISSTCDRCRATNSVTNMSRFNMDIICQSCDDLEHQHPLYEVAAAAELLSVMQHEYNFPGIGKPNDL
jgi:pectin methylesterase-like acyl-CoA thioesterase